MTNIGKNSFIVSSSKENEVHIFNIHMFKYEKNYSDLLNTQVVQHLKSEIFFCKEANLHVNYV